MERNSLTDGLLETDRVDSRAHDGIHTAPGIELAGEAHTSPAPLRVGSSTGGRLLPHRRFRATVDLRAFHCQHQA